MQKNTLETLYPDINNYNNSNNANYITIEDNTIYITSRILFTGDAYSYFPNNNITYAEVIEGRY